MQNKIKKKSYNSRLEEIKELFMRLDTKKVGGKDFKEIAEELINLAGLIYVTTMEDDTRVDISIEKKLTAIEKKIKNQFRTIR